MLEKTLTKLRCPRTGAPARKVVEGEVRNINGVDHYWSGRVDFGETHYPIEDGILCFHADSGQPLYESMWAGDFRKEVSGQSVYGAARREKLLTRLGCRSLGWLEGKTFLDVGCGLGRFTHAAVELGADVMALDLALPGVKNCFRRLSETLPTESFGRCDFIQANALESVFKRESFDVVFSSYALHHMESTRRAIETIGAYVAKEGNLTVTVFREDSGHPLSMWWFRDAVMNIPEETRLRALAKLGLLEIDGVETVIDYPALAEKISADSDLKAVSDQLGLPFIMHRENFTTPYIWFQTANELKRWFESAGFTVESDSGETMVGWKGRTSRLNFLRRMLS